MAYGVVGRGLACWFAGLSPWHCPTFKPSRGERHQFNQPSGSDVWCAVIVQHEGARQGGVAGMGGRVHRSDWSLPPSASIAAASLGNRTSSAITSPATDSAARVQALTHRSGEIVWRPHSVPSVCIASRALFPPRSGSRSAFSSGLPYRCLAGTPSWASIRLSGSANGRITKP